ncbi:MAG: polymer-forming cytoskeletal protein [SAR324 cluster bacterium]|nr:polymer-forming cytoskeletal protein [SAR324 cluster bacterium]
MMEKILVKSMLRNLSKFSLMIAIMGTTVPVYADSLKSMQISKDYELGEDLVANDITCNHSRLNILGKVKGRIFSVDCDVTVGHQSLLEKGIIFAGGSLSIQEKATITGDISQIGGILQIPPNVDLQGVIRRYPKKDEPPKEFLQASLHYLTFQRIVPVDVDHLNRSIAELLQKGITETHREPLKEFTIPEFAEYVFKPDYVRFAQKWTYIKEGYNLEMQIMEFKSSAESLIFWKNIMRLGNVNMSHSVLNSMGDGGHGYYRYKDRSTILWYRGDWIFSLQVLVPEKLPVEKNWRDAEIQRDGFISMFYESLKNNTLNLDSGDIFVGSWPSEEIK